MKTSVLLDHEPVADGGYLVRALLLLEADAAPDSDRTPVNVSLVLDRSGSMSGVPLHAAREAAVGLVQRLAVDDVVSVVAYDDAVAVVAPPATGDAQAHLTRQIRQIGPGGCTNLSGGWLRGRDLVAESARDGGVNRVVLLTDGLANAGITDPDTLVGLCRSAAAMGITTTTVGFGSHYDEDLLRAMAEAGGGAAYYIERPDQAAGVFEEELEGLTSIAAQNARVEVRPGQHADFIQVVHAYPSHAEGDALTVEVGDVYAREPRRILMEFLLKPEASDVEMAEVGRLTVTAHVLTEGGGVELQTVTLPIALSPTDGGSVQPEVRREALLLEAARAREAALRARDEGDWDAARAILRDPARRAEALGIDDPEVLEEVQDLAAMSEAFDAQAVSEADVKYMKQRAYSTSSSRRSQLGRYRRE
ncbi:MAG: VWA domain-containing protein [Longimicrobiales bacterium]